MSIRATNFVRRVRGLTPTEKLVAFVLADHDNHKGRGSYVSMTTVALEAGLKHRQTASSIVKRLLARGVVLTDRVSRGRVTTVYHFNYALTDCNPPVAVNRDSPVTANCHSTIAVTPTPTATLDASNRNSTVVQPQLPSCRKGVLEGFEGGQRSGYASASHARRRKELSERDKAILRHAGVILQ